jgi:hypothetical protein
MTDVRIARPSLRRWLFCLLVALGAGIETAGAQTPTPGVPAGPPIDIHGEWAITRTYVRRCPRCAAPVIRTVPWEITQTGADVRVDRGLRGTVTGAGPAFLHLEGTESEGFGLQRFWYATLHVSADGNWFEGPFSGSEQMQNPCGDSPPSVTCLVSAGWIRGQRVAPLATVPPPPGPPILPPPAPTETATPIPPTETSTPAPLAQPSAQPLVPTAWPLASAGGRVAFMPWAATSRSTR